MSRLTLQKDSWGGTGSKLLPVKIKPRQR